MNRRGINVFLTEAIVMTAVLALALSICLGVFAKASQMGSQADDLSLGASLVYSACQCYISTGDLAQTSVLMGGDGGDVTIDGLTLSFSQDDDYVYISAMRDSQTIFASKTPVEVIK